jgi:hypothetical protein
MPAPSLGNIPIVTQAEEHFADLAQTEKDDALQADDDEQGDNDESGHWGVSILAA